MYSRIFGREEAKRDQERAQWGDSERVRSKGPDGHQERGHELRRREQRHGILTCARFNVTFPAGLAQGRGEKQGFEVHW